MQTIRILADDLTGALDTAGCFAGDGRMLPVVFDAAHLPKTGSCAVSTQSRDVTESEAVERMDRFHSLFDGHEGIAFKKIDSLLRGHVAAEIAHLVRHGDFHAAVIAPAFPALDRVTRNARQWAKLAGDERLHVVGPDLRSDFARFGIDLRPGHPGPLQSASLQVFMADAETDRDLQAIVDAGKRAGRVLWCGSAGLAGVLAGSRSAEPSFAAQRMLAICGTRHPVASLQLECLSSQDRSGVMALQPGYDPAMAAQTINERLCGGNWAAIAADFPQLPAAEAQSMLDGIISSILPKLVRPDALFVMGGETLQLCCDRLGAHQLSVRGLLVPGIPVSEFHDGEWAGLTVVSKSGAFGTVQTLCDIVGSAGGKGTATKSSSIIRSGQKVSSH